MKILFVSICLFTFVLSRAQDDIKQGAGDASRGATGHAEETHPTVGDRLHTLAEATEHGENAPRLGGHTGESVAGTPLREGLSAPREGAGNLSTR
ncbi:hypothetical protein AAVH_22324 [Aphelenchoides avenae]|nr:hypothetical protein AAVH_22324 [Aphelenchus avenae]